MKRETFYAILAIVMLTSCSDMTSGSRYNESSYYVSGLLKAGEYIIGENAVKFGQTQDIEDADWEALPDPTAEVHVKESASDGSITGEISLIWDANVRGYIDQEEEMPVKAGYTYKLEIYKNGNIVVSASTTVPEMINVLGDQPAGTEPVWDESSDTDKELELEQADSKHPVIIETQSDAEFNLYSEFWCFEDYQEAEYTYPEDNEYPADEEEYMGDTRQYPRRNMGYYMYQPENGVLEFNNYQSSIMFYGKTRLRLYSIDTNYLSYLYKADGYAHGGIEGGIGVFGSYCGKELYTIVIKS